MCCTSATHTLDHDAFFSCQVQKLGELLSEQQGKMVKTRARQEEEEKEAEL